MPIISTSYGGNAQRLAHRDDHRDQECDDDDGGHCPSNHSSSIGSADLAIYQSIEQLNKTTGCFPLERRHRSKKRGSANSGKVPLTIVANRNCESENSQQQIGQKSHRNHFDRLFERFQSKRIPNKSTGVNQTKRKNSIEQKAFYRWLHLSRNKRLERNIKCLDDVGYDDWHSLRRTPVIRKCSTKSNSIRRKTAKKTKKKSTKSTSRFSSCIPYCVTISASTTAVAASACSRNDSIAGNSLASSHRYTEYYCKKRSKGTLSAAASNAADRHRLPSPPAITTTTSNDCLMHYTHCKSNKHFRASNKNTDNNHNNNCSLFNNLNIMDRSVDSIGSCSLDVDAESTDFSGIRLI